MSDSKPADSEVHIWLEELNVTPINTKMISLSVKGYKMYDYPLRDTSYIIYVKRRRWINHTIRK